MSMITSALNKGSNVSVREKNLWHHPTPFLGIESQNWMRRYKAEAW